MKSFSYIVSLIPLLLSVAITTNVEEAYFEGRTADLILRPKTIESSGSLFFINKYGLDSSIEQMEEKNIGNLICDAMGVSLLNDQSQSVLPHGSAFDKSKANLFVVLDTAVDISTVKSLRVLSQTEKSVPMVPSSYPQDTVATVASMVTGTTPTTHGIVGSSWLTFSGAARAYKALATPQVANFVDIVSQTFQGNSLTISASADFQLASALGVHQYLHNDNPAWNNLGLYYNRANKQYESVFSNLKNAAFKFTEADIIGNLTSRPFLFPTQQDTGSFDRSSEFFTVQLPSQEIVEPIEFNLHAGEDWSLFVELHFMLSLVEMLSTDDNLKALTADRFPDLFSFAFSSLKAIQLKYGTSSNQMKAAIVLIDGALSQLMEKLNVIYNGKISAEIAVLGVSPMRSLKTNTRLKYLVWKAVSEHVTRDSYEKFFPIVYFEIPADYSICDSLYSLADEKTEVICQPRVFTEDFFVHLLSNTSSNNSNNSNGTYTIPNAPMFHITLWTVIAMILAVYGAIYALFSMEINADSMLYRSTKHHHAN